MNYHIITFGCQMNKSDSERIAGFLQNNNYKESSLAKADLVVINMCSVRQSAVDRVYGLIPKLKNKTTILTGCFLKKDKRKLEQYFDYVLNINDKWPIKRIGNPVYSHFPIAYIPISFGCNNYCSYCVVPYTRGPETHRPEKDIIKQAKHLIKKGYKEIWLLGQNVNSFNNFDKLLIKISNIPGRFWIRFTSSHPKDFNKKTIKAMKGKVTPYLNLAVQSGDNKVLERMNRKYKIQDYKNIIKELRKSIPDITLSTDIIVGFPGETKQQFNNTKKLLQEIKYDMVYISQYSPRQGTAAFKLNDNITKKEKKQREKELTNILKKTALQNNKKYINKTVEVLSTEYKKGYVIGKSFHYKTVKFKGTKSLIGKFVKVKIENAFEWGLYGKRP